MFEALLQKVLKRLFGHFFDGLDAKKLHLGIWSGRLVIEGVALRKELFEMAGLPYELLFSCIQKMTVQVPWKSISSTPVEIELDSMLVLVVAKPRKDWQQKGLEDVQRLITDLNNFIGGYLNRLIENEKTTVATASDKKGYLDNIYVRVLDNLQFAIRNIHVRYEDNLSRGYSFGVTLQSLEVFTSNEQGQRIYVDRTSVENSKAVLLKTVELKNLGIYWKDTETVFLHDSQNQKQMAEFLQREIYKGGADQASPNYMLMLNSRSLLKQRPTNDLSGPRYDLNFNLGELRIKLSKTIVQQLISFLQYRTEYIDRSVVGGQPQQASRFKELFKKYYIGYETDRTDLSKSERAEFEQLLLELKQQQIRSIAQAEIKLQYRNRIITKMINRKGNMLLEEADMAEIQQYMQKLARSNIEEMPLPPTYVYIHCGITFTSLSLFLVDDAQRTIFEITLQRIRTLLRLAEQEQYFAFEISDIKSQGKDLRDILWKEGPTEFLKAEYSQIIGGRQRLFVRVCPVSLVYDMRTIDQLRQFSQVTVKTNLRNKAIDKVEELGAEVGKNIQRRKAVELDIAVDTPTIFLLEGRRRWMVEFGQFTLNKTDDTAIVRIANMKASCLTDSKVFDCVPSFSVAIAFNPTALVANVEISSLRLKIDRVHYQSLMSLLTVIRKHTNKSDIMERSTRKALVFLKEKNWKKVMATIAEGYLYFWEKKEYPLAVVRIRTVLIGTDANRSNSLVIGDRLGHNYLIAFEDAGVMSKWLADLQKIASVQFQEEAEVSRPDSTTFELRLTIGSVQLLLLAPNSEQWLKVKVQTIRVRHIQSALEATTHASVHELSVGTAALKLLNCCSQKDFLSCELHTISEQHQSYAKQDSISKLKLSRLELNYDPALVLRIFSFLETDSDYSPPEQMFDEQTMQKMSQDRLLSLVDLEVEGVSVLLINKKTNQPLAKMLLQRIAVKLSSYYYQNVKEGSIGDISIVDLTNYPKTVYEEGSQTVVVPKLIWGGADLLPSECMMQFRMTTLEDGSKKLEKDRYETVSVRILKARLVYMHEPVMRIIDYLQVQLKGVLQNPEIFDEYHQEADQRRRPTDYKEFIRKKEETIENRKLQAVGKERVKKLLESPRELYMEVFIEQPQLVVVSTGEQSIQFRLASISIANEFYYSDDRILTGSLKAVLCERYRIIFEEVELALLPSKRAISDQQFDINLSLDMFFKESEYKFIAEEPLKLDTSIAAKMFVAPLYFTLGQAGALEIQRVAKLNILHEDGLDFLMVHDYIPPEPDGLSVQLHFESINLTLLEEEQSMVEFDIEFLRYSYRKQPTQENRTEVEVANLQAKFFTRGEYRQMISRRRNLKMSTSRRNLSLSAYRSSRVFEIPKKELPPHVCLSYRSAQSRTQVATRISLTDNVMVLQTDFIFFLKKWAKLPSISPLPKVFLKEKPLEKPKSITQLSIVPQNRSVMLTRNLVSCVIPNSEKMLNCLFSAVFTENSANERLFNLEDLELFFCKISDISTEDFSSIKRRTFMSDFGMQCRMLTTPTETVVTLSLSRVVMKFSLRDIKMLALLADVLQSKIKRLTEEEADKPSPAVQPSRQKLTVGIKSRSIEILLINDTANRYFPILYFNIEALKDIEVAVVDQLIVAAQIRLFARYFNLKISVWEPVLESTDLHIAYRKSLTESPRTSLVVGPLSREEYTTVDVSTNFVETLVKTLNDMELEFRSFEQSDWLSDSMNGCVVVNNSGYPIECYLGGQRFLIESDARHELKIRQLEAQQLLIQATATDMYMEVEIPLSGTHLRNLNIKSEDVTRVVITTRKKPTYLVKVVRIDIAKNIRFVSLVSPVLLVNSTGVDLAIRIGELAPETPFFNGAVRSIPFDDVETTVRMVYDGQVSEPMRIFEDSKSIRLGSYTFNISEVMRQESRRITLESPYRLTSLLPHPLYMNFKMATGNFYSLSFPSFDPKQVVTRFFLEDIQRSEVSWFVEADSMLWTPYAKFTEGIQTIEDIFGSSFTVELQRIQKPQENSVNYVIFPSVVILNKSEELLSFYYSNKSLIPGQTLHTQNRSVISSRLHTLIIGSQGRDMYSPPIKLTKEPKEMILRLEKSIDGESVKVNCIMLLQWSPVSLYDIRFDKYTLSCQYRLVNRSSVEMLVRHANALMTETTKLTAGSHSNLYWFGDDYEKEIRATPNASNWEWSAPLNIERAQLTHFILRDRSNYRKLLFMTLEVKLVQQQRNIELKVLTDPNDYPFLLVNECDQVNVVVPAFKTTLSAGNQVYFSWDDPAKQLYQVEVVLQPSQPDNSFKERVLYLKEKRVENEVVELKATKGVLKLEIDVETRISQKIFRFRSYVPQVPLDTANDSHYQISLPLAICLINNTEGRSVNLLSAYAQFSAEFIVGEEERKQLKVDCTDVQVDNNTKLYVYFPVVLRTGFHMMLVGRKDTWLELEVQCDKIILRLQEDFVYEVYSLFLLLQSFLPPQPNNNQPSFSISRVKLPKLDVQLQVQAKKLSIETPIELEQPPQTSYPWANIPYPIKDIVLQLLSNLSISPISFISSLHEGVVNLFNQSNSGRGVESFLTRIIGSIGSGINGMVRILVGDMERIDTFVDGVETGTVTCLRTTLSSLSTLFYEPTPVGLLKTVAGLIYKPVTGLLQLTLKITEGIKNTAKFSFQVEDNETRKRPPIVFYGSGHYYKQYDPMSAQLMQLLQQFQGGRYKDISLTNVIYLNQEDKQMAVIVVSDTHLLYLTLQSKKCVWSVPLEHIRQAKLREELNAVQLMLSAEAEGLPNRNPIIVVGENRQARSLYESLEEGIRKLRLAS